MNNNNMRCELLEKLRGGDLRSIGKVDFIVNEIKSQNDFDVLFHYLYSCDRLIVMRTADAIEKITAKHVDFLCGHKEEIFAFCERADNIEFKWHLALLLPRLSFTENEYTKAIAILSSWLRDPKESKIVRTNSLQALFELSKYNIMIRQELDHIVRAIEKEDVPSLLARIRKIRRK